LINIIIPAHNAERHLGAALDSVQSQTERDWQALVVDDGSTDGTAGIAEGYLGDERIRLVRQANGGPSAARNAGLAQAQGDYVALLDADDAWRPYYLARMVEALEHAPQAPAAACGWQYMDDAGQPLAQQVVISAEAAARLGETLAWENPLIPSGLVMRIKAARLCGEFDRGLHGVEDWDYAWRVTGQGALAWVAEALVWYRTHPANLSTDFERMEHERVKLLHKHFPALAGGPETWPAAARRGLASARLQAALEWVGAGQLEGGQRKLREALALWPPLAGEKATHYALACAHQPRGHKGTAAGLDLGRAEAALTALLQEASALGPTEQRATKAQANLVLAQLARQAQQRGAGARFALAAMRAGAPDQRMAALRALARSVTPRRS
jgi:GT2 family glycosyltransferase